MSNRLSGLTPLGTREIFRQFLRLPDGAITEMFGTMMAERLDGRIRATLMRASVDLGKLLTGATKYLNDTLQTQVLDCFDER